MLVLLWLALVWFKKWDGCSWKGFDLWKRKEKYRLDEKWTSAVKTGLNSSPSLMPLDGPTFVLAVRISKREPNCTKCCSFLEWGEKCFETLFMLSYSERPYCWLRKNTLAFLHYHISSYQFVLDWKGETKNLFLSFTWNFKSNCMIKLQSA